MRHIVETRGGGCYRGRNSTSRKFEQRALVAVSGTPAEFAASLEKGRVDWGAFIQRNCITPE